MTIQAIIFDVDGTLADTRTAPPSFNKAFSENGLDWNWDARCTTSCSR